MSTTPDFSKDPSGLIPAIAQDWQTGEILMLAYINEDAWNETKKSGHATYWTRSRQRLWRKGESSGNVQIIKEILIDCDNDTVVFKVEQIGKAACHTVRRSCFFRKITDYNCEIVSEQIFDPKEVYNK